jgi:hypothetical protein
MSSESKPTRRLRLLMSGNAPGVEELESLLRSVDELRLTLETDLSLMASAVESGAPDLAVEILDSDRQALRRFEDSALDSLSTLAAKPPRRRRLMTGAAPAAAAAALVAVLAGLLPQGVGTRPTDIATSTVAASDSLALLQDMVLQGDEQRVRQASATLHEQLAAVVSQAKTDPLVAQQALLILSYEQSAIVSHGSSALLADVLVRSRELAKAIRAALPKTARTAVPPISGDEPKAKPKPAASAKASPSPKPTASPKPSSTPSPRPTASPTSSPSKDAGFIPETPNLSGG